MNSEDLNKNAGFSNALNWIKSGYRVQREGWNGKNMFIFLRGGESIPKEITMNIKSIQQDVKEFMINTNTQMVFASHIMMFTADKKLVPWLASQTDILAEDWSVVNK